MKPSHLDAVGYHQDQLNKIFDAVETGPIATLVNSDTKRYDVPTRIIFNDEEIDNVRPLIVIPTWIDSLLRRTCSKPQAEAVKDIWNSLADDFLKIDFVKQHKSALKFGLRLSTRLSLATLSRALLWLKNEIRGRE